MVSPLLPVTYSFRIPSLHDSTPLDCRIHHPPSFDNLDCDSSGAKWARKAAILAHPYAVLGGGFDDPILENAGAELLAQGYVVGTFNFRGAYNSSSRTSWTGKPELADYASFAGALVCYIHALKLPSTSSTVSASKAPVEDGQPIQIIFGGYSYGSLIVTRLPPLEILLAPFQSAPTSHATNIIHQLASSLAARTSEELLEQHEALKKQSQLSPTSPRSFEIKRKSTVIVGGYDSDPATAAAGSSSKRKSQDAGAAAGRRSLSLDLRRPRSWGKEPRSSFHAPQHHRRHGDTAADCSAVANGGDKSDDDNAPLPPPPPLPHPSRLAISPAYLLVSPLLPPLSFLIAPSLALPSLSLSLFSSSGSQTANPLTMHPTLIAFGSHDGFTGSKRLRAWCGKLAAEASANAAATSSSNVVVDSAKARAEVTWHQVEGAGHFWVEQGAMRELRALVRAWARKLG